MFKPDEILGYHAHVYFSDEASRQQAARLRELIAQHFDVQLGDWRDIPVGPHPLAMYQVSFSVDDFKTFVPWLMANRSLLTVLVHACTDQGHYVDHTAGALWLGESVALRLEFFNGKNQFA